MAKAAKAISSSGRHGRVVVMGSARNRRGVGVSRAQRLAEDDGLSSSGALTKPVRVADDVFVGRSDVREIQRARLFAAMVEVCVQRGAANATVAHVVARSGVSRRTFYEQFEDREACFLDTFDQAIERIAKRVIPAFQGESKWRDGVRAGLSALLEFLDEEPGIGRFCIVETLAAGDRALARRADILGVLIETIDEGRKTTRKPGPPPLTAEGTVGAVLAVIHARLLERSVVYPPRERVAPRKKGQQAERTGKGGRGRSTSVSFGGLLNPLMGMIVLPYLGQSAAQRELARPVSNPPTKRDPARVNPLRDLDMRLTYRTVRVLMATATHPDASNRQIARTAGVEDQGQISKLLSRLSHLGLIQNNGPGHAHGEPNAWTLTPKGHEIQQALTTQATH